MTTDLCTEDVVVRITTPQIISSETIVPSVSAGAAGSRVAASSAAVELGRRLLLAARAGDTALVLDLMAKGAPFTTDWLGTSPLHLAAGNAHADTCAVLLRAGVSRDARTKVERTPLHLAAYGGHAAVARLLLEAGANVDCRDMLRMTPLHWAVQRGHAATVAALLAHGADPRATSKFHKSPRALARQLARADLLRLLDDAAQQRDAAQERGAAQQRGAAQPGLGRPQAPLYSVHDSIVSDQMGEAPSSEQQPQTFDAVQRIQDTKQPKSKQQAERILKTDIKAEGGPAAALLRAHGITLLPADDGSTVLSALQSGRTVVLSDAGKLMLKESESPQAAASKPSSMSHCSKNMVLTATPVKSPPKPGMKIFTLNNKLLAIPKESNKIPVKKIINPQDMQQVKFVQLPADAKIISPSKITSVTSRSAGGGQRPAVKIIMNKSNFHRLIANATRSEDIREAPVPAASAPSGPSEAVSEDEEEEAGEAEGEASAGVLRARLRAARRALGAARRDLRAARARLAQLGEPGC